MSIQKKMISYTIVLVFASVLLLGGAFFMQRSNLEKDRQMTSDTLDNNNQVQIENQVESLSDNVVLFLTEMEEVIDAQMRNSALTLQKLDTYSEVDLATMQQVADETGMSDMYFTDIDGNFTMSTVEESAGGNLFEIGEFYRALVTGDSEEVPSPIKVMVETGEIYKFTAIPRYDENGKIIGIIQSALNAGRIETSIENLLGKYEMLRAIYVLQPDGLVLTSNSTDQAVSEFPKGEFLTGDADFTNAIEQNESLIVKDNNNAIFNYKPVMYNDEIRYVVVTEIDESYYLENTDFAKEQMIGLTNAFERNLLIIVAFLLLLVIAIVVVYIVFFRKNILHPMDEMVGVAEKLAVGDMQIQLPPAKKDEIGNLIAAFKQVVDAMKEQTSVMEHLADGDFPEEIELRSDVDTMSISMNRLIGAQREYIGEISNVMSEMVKGNLDARIETDFAGEFAPIKQSVNTAMDQQQQLIMAIQDILKYLADGELSKTIDTPFEGDYDNLRIYINDMILAQRQYVKGISNVMNHLKVGDLSVEISDDFKGDFAPIQDAINETATSLNTYIKEIEQVLRSIAEKDLSKTIDAEFAGDFDILRKSLTEILDFLNETMYDINNRADQVAISAEAIADGSQSLAEATDSQVHTVENLYMLTEKIAEEAQNNLKNATKARETGQRTMDEVTAGNEKMEHLVTAMDKISKSSNEINKIISSITDIAFQTNLLAINASIEAAHAGSAGRGFAIVAEQVRELANRSNESANSVAVLIDESVESAEEGQLATKDVANSLEKIVDSTKTTFDLNEEMSKIIAEQAEKSNEIANGLSNIRDLAQSNLGTSEEAAGSSQELSAQAQLLREMVQTFKLSGDDGDIGIIQRDEQIDRYDEHEEYDEYEY